MNRFREENQDLLKIIFYSVITGIITISLIILFVFVRKEVINDTYYDSISETNLETKNTGAISNNLILFIGLDKIANSSSIPTDLNAQSAAIIKEYFTYAYPKSERLSYKNGSAKKEGNTYMYDTQLNTGEKFTIKIIDNKNSTFELSITDKNNEVFSYNSAKYSEEYKNIRSFANNFLPKVFTNEEGLSFSITYKNDKYYLNINACNNQEIIDKAEDIAKNWITSVGFNPDQITFDIPYMCDGGYN